MPDESESEHARAFLDAQKKGVQRCMAQLIMSTFVHKCYFISGGLCALPFPLPEWKPNSQLRTWRNLKLAHTYRRPIHFIVYDVHSVMTFSPS